ncbi:hypothetical protein [Hymenobacter tenuis]
MPDSFIQIIIKNGDVQTWLAFDDNAHLLAKGEPAAVWKVKTAADGTPLFEADGITPQSGKLLYHVIGDGFTRFSLLEQLWPVPKGAFNSVVSSRQGQARDPDDLTKTNATLRFETFGEWVDANAHPFAKPTFSSFTPDSYTDREVGEPLARTFAFGWASSKAENVQPGSVSIQQTFNGTTTNIATGLNASGTFTPSGLAALVGTTIGQKAVFTLNGASTKGTAMPPLERTAEWKGKRTIFLHDDAQWLTPGMTAKVGDPVGTYVSADATVAALINTALNGAAGVLGNGTFGLQTLDGGTSGKRAYLAYPKDYKTTARFIDPNFNVDQAPVRTREITITRNGVAVVYVLMGLDLRIVQQLSSYVS